MQLTAGDQAIRDGTAAAMAMRIVLGTARMLGASDLVSIASAHIDGCLYHGDSGTHFAERLAEGGGGVSVPATLNVGALDLLHAGRVKLPSEQATMARRMMQAYVKLGCRQTWTCAPYQAGHRPSLGQDVAWGESNAVAFCNSALGARTNRYGDFLDIWAAITGRVPRAGLHLPEKPPSNFADQREPVTRRPVRQRRFLPRPRLLARAGGRVGRRGDQRAASRQRRPAKSSRGGGGIDRRGRPLSRNRDHPGGAR